MSSPTLPEVRAASVRGQNGHAPSAAAGRAPLLVRHPGNPVLAADDLPLPDAACVFNSGVALHRGEIVMLVNAWDAEWTPAFMVARSRDGVHFEVDPRRVIVSPTEYPYVAHEGIFDTRVTPLEGAFYVTYNVASHLGGRIRLVRTEDFSAFEDLGFITAPDHRNCTIFPERIGGAYARLERPNVGETGDIYISYSPDLIHWGRTELLLEKGSRYWESAKIGAGAPPLRTPRGWLVLYHSARKGMNGYSYQMGALLLDLADPRKILGKLKRPLLAPEEPYERVGLVGNVVFPTGVVAHGGSGELKIYYGAADTCMCLATADQEAIVDACLADGPWSRAR